MINIAIDGPAGAGKSTIAKAVAKDLGIIYLDTGAMYRATAYLALQKGIDVKDEEKVAEMLEDLTMDIKYDENGAQRIIVNGIDATPYLRRTLYVQSRKRYLRIALREIQNGGFAA